MTKNLKDYAFIGDCNSAALVHKSGSIDWCCIPVFDSPAIFSSLLGAENSGYFLIQPAEKFSSYQNYIPGTNVSQIRFETSSGTLLLTDAFAVRSEEEKQKELFPDHELLRMVRCTSGKVKVRMEYRPVIFYGKTSVKFRGNKNFGFKFQWKSHIYILQSNLDYDKFHTPENRNLTRVEFDLEAGEQVIFSLSYSCQNPAIIPEINKTASIWLQRTIRYWSEWISLCKYTGSYKEAVRRSILVLKLLTHAPSGAIVAAPTTSLPEIPGGSRNWDYRFCWLRDASFTVRALMQLGYTEEIKAYMNWILHATKLTFPKIQVVYTIYGHSRIDEKVLDWLPGYKKSKPVRIGNGAHAQFQLDVYGEVLDSFFSYSEIAPQFSNETRRFIISLAGTICKIWRKPDNGIWESRRELRHHTHSKVMAWVGLDRTVQLCEKYKWKNVPLEKFKKTRDEIRDDVEKNGFNQELQAYTQVYHGKAPDAGLLTLPLVKFCDAQSPRMKSTLDCIREKLLENNFIYRYKTHDGLEGTEAAFGICTFWYIENLAKTGQIKKAAACFESVLNCTGPTGLLAEEIIPETGELTGNFPQGFSHIGLINAALSLQEGFENKQS